MLVLTVTCSALCPILVTVNNLVFMHDFKIVTLGENQITDIEC
jgi:hypothetical protein